VEDALFGVGGVLTDHAPDGAVRQQLLDLWESERPRGERADVETEERAARHREWTTAAAKKEKASATLAGAASADNMVLLADPVQDAIAAAPAPEPVLPPPAKNGGSGQGLEQPQDDDGGLGIL
jgi:hypothetical protein